MKDFAKSIVCNTKAEVEKVGNELTSFDKAMKRDLEKRLKNEEQLLADAKKMLRTKLDDDDRIGYEMQKEESEKNVRDLKEKIRKIGNSKCGNAYKPNPEVIKILEDLTWKRISADEARKKLEAAIKDKNIADLMVANPKGFIPVGNEEVKNESVASHPDSKVAIEIYDTYLKSGKDENKTVEILSEKYKSIPKEGLKKHIKDAIKAYGSITKNSKVGNFTVAEGVKGNPGPQYADMIKEAKSLISKIQQKINSYEKAQNINWGHVGDVEHYVRLLRQMV